jgi:hypothetical protein
MRLTMRRSSSCLVSSRFLKCSSFFFSMNSLLMALTRLNLG